MESLVGAVPGGALTAHHGAPGHHPGAEQALVHLHGLEQALVELATPLRGSQVIAA